MHVSIAHGRVVRREWSMRQQGTAQSLTRRVVLSFPCRVSGVRDSPRLLRGHCPGADDVARDRRLPELRSVAAATRARQPPREDACVGGAAVARPRPCRLGCIANSGPSQGRRRKKH